MSMLRSSPHICLLQSQVFCCYCYFAIHDLVEESQALLRYSLLQCLHVHLNSKLVHIAKLQRLFSLDPFDCMVLYPFNFFGLTIYNIIQVARSQIHATHEI